MSVDIVFRDPEERQQVTWSIIGHERYPSQDSGWRRKGDGAMERVYWRGSKWWTQQELNATNRVRARTT